MGMGYVDFKLGEWKDDLIWCPSQCYLDIVYKNIKYELYLRWRHDDPWSACICDYKIYENPPEYIDLPIQYWKDSQLEECKLNAMILATEWLKNNK